MATMTRLLMLLCLTACGRSSLLPGEDQLRVGTWGGEGAGVIVTDSTVHVHIGCTYGDIVGIVSLEPDGTFETTGEYVLRAYPIMMGPALPARFTGRVAGVMQTLSVTVTDTTDNNKLVVLGPVTVRLGREPALGTCPICRDPGDNGRIP